MSQTPEAEISILIADKHLAGLSMERRKALALDICNAIIQHARPIAEQIITKTSNAEITKLKQENSDMLGAILLLAGNPHLCLDDLVYQVREREGLGWEGPSVLLWSQAVETAKDIIAKAKK